MDSQKRSFPKIFRIALPVLILFVAWFSVSALRDPHATFPGDAQGLFKREPYVLETPVGYHAVWEVSGKCEKASYSFASTPKIGPFDDYENIEWGGGGGECVFDGATSYCSAELLKESLEKQLPYYIQVGSSTCDGKDKELTSEVVEIR